jgi:hypothetical protein
MKLATFATFAVVLVAGTGAQAATYNFNMSYDGTTVTLNPGSDNPTGTVLNVGDTYKLNLSAVGSEFWTVNSSFSTFLPLTFFVDESGTRSADVSTDFFNDGGLVQNITESGITQQFIHVGAQQWTLAAGTVFDQVMLSWTLLSIDPNGPSTISSADFLNSGNGIGVFFDNPNVSFSASVVPVPAALPLLITSIVGAYGVARRRNRKTV